MGITIDQLKVDILNEFGEKSDQYLLVSKLIEENNRLKLCFHWALGYADFKEKQPNEGKFWWRTELFQRSGMEIEELERISESVKLKDELLPEEKEAPGQLSFIQPLMKNAIEDTVMTIKMYKKNIFMGFLYIGGAPRAYFVVDKSTELIDYKIAFYNMHSKIENPDCIISYLGLLHDESKDTVLRAFNIK